ncbi:hypothetical protein Tco_1386278 [Tanacetum coccineum]
MSSSTHPIIVLSDSYIEDAFSSTNTPDYTPASSDYFPSSPGAYNATSNESRIPLPRSIGSPTVLLPSLLLHHQHYLIPILISTLRRFATQTTSLFPYHPPIDSSALPQDLRLERVLHKSIWERHEEPDQGLF